MDGRESARRHSDRTLWIALIFIVLALAIILESICLGALYLYNSLSGNGNDRFAQNHLLTSLLVSAPSGPVPGKHFLGHLNDDDRWDGWDEFLLPDSLLGWRLGVNVAVYDSPSTSTDEYLYLTDGNGFSTDVDDPLVTMEKPADVYRVIILGGSTVMGAGSPRPSQNLVGMLRRAVHDQGITAADGKRIEFVNAGVDAYNSAQEYLYFVSDLARFSPDLVIVYDGWNDSHMWYDNSIVRNMSPFRTKRHQEGTRRIQASYSVSGSALSALANLSSSLTQGRSRLGALELLWRVFRKPASDDDVDARSATYDPRLVKYYQKIHRAFLALADGQLAVAIFLQPVVGVDGRTLSKEEKTSWWYSDFESERGVRTSFYEDARRVLAELKETSRGKPQTCIADVSDSLKGITEPVYADTGHLLPIGNSIVASRILDELASCGLVAKHGSSQRR
jgi:hypothetical protein